MFDDLGRRAIAVPHQTIEAGYMDQQHVRVIHPVRGIGWMFLRRVMLEINFG
jgi:hypothetical protein